MVINLHQNQSVFHNEKLRGLNVIGLFLIFISFLRFYSNWEVTASGFKIKYESIPSPCGAETHFTSSNGQITSLRHPLNFPGTPDCIYTISLKNGTFVKISIVDIQLNTTEQCRESFLEIRDGRDGNGASLLDRFCGEMQDLPSTYLQSKSPDVWIRYIYTSMCIHS